MKRRRSQHEPGRLRWALAALLEKELGITISPYDLYPAQGWWRSSSDSMQARWDGYGTRVDNGIEVKVHVFSWDTMTKCVRWGISYFEERSGMPQIEVSTNEPTRKSA